MTIYLLDTNIISYIIRGDHPIVLLRLAAVPVRSVSTSVLSEAELRFGLAKRGYPHGLTTRVEEFLMRIAVLPWTRDVTHAYASLRAQREASGRTLSRLDLLIAAHAQAVGAVLVTSDAAFFEGAGGPSLEDWTK